ncbi:MULTISPECIES: DUF1656 domain-containing protein [Modicisalibacter]|uniref:DUF1656 domain-containing protein n=1 Tax=Modicisalibacter TaxID=574347 RepID=UPI00100B4D0D|nr:MULTISPECIES: DUF1656 domain-containing protein [Halomonadaceae]MBZ9559831.1 DUF1656 domain-containing protein [Modicisalibacter sp. R2A 31.J]MBZ9577283.1 DUF1656 domain-containing protein [Modicisalibacter sp. MOD 31.J]
MGLREIAVGGIYLSPLLLYALLGFLCAVAVRTLLHRFMSQQVLWYEAWFDAALFVILTAAIAFMFSFANGTAA